MGWIKLDRQIAEHEIWNSEPFSRGQAWIDLLLSAEFEQRRTMNGWQKVILNRGQQVVSIRALCERWKWSKHKVSDYLQYLEKEEMIKTKKETFGTLLTIVNYGIYQDIGDTKGTRRGHLGDTSGTETGHLGDAKGKPSIKERNIRSKEVKKDIPKIAHGEFQNVLLTDEEYGKLQQTIPNADNLIERLSAYIESTGKKYKSHYATLLNWDRRDRGGKQKTEQSITDVLREEYAKSMREGSE